MTATAPTSSPSLHHDHGYGPLIGLHPSMQQLYEEIARVAKEKVAVVVTGATGAGKEVAAEALHQASERRGPCRTYNLHAVPESIAESELFGVVKGAYTGATESRSGLIAAAHRGTLVLDEAADLSLRLQAKLLRVLDTSRVRPIGTPDETMVDIRLVLCTQREPFALMAEGLWRRDFFYRVTGWVLRVPPLAERRSDLDPLARHLLSGRAAPTDWADVASELAKHDWPGNVRELRVVLERAALFAGQQPLEGRHVMLALRHQGGGRSLEAQAAPPGWRRSLEQVKREHIRQVLEGTGFNIAVASTILGISRSALYGYRRAWDLGGP
jgi:DNA-binding NtrC family response regulator